MTAATLSPAQAPVPSPLPTPLSAGERVGGIDIVRGAAIFGILLVNVTTFRPHPATLQGTPWTGLPDRIAEWGILFFAAGKVWPMLAFLFGLGFAVQLGRARAGTPILPRYARRLTALLAIGLLHNVLLWDGDILVNYALIGFLLLPFARRRPRTVLRWAIGLLAAFVGLIAVAALVVALQGPVHGPGASAAPASDPAQALRRTGSYGALLTARLGALAGSATENLGGAPITLAIFLTGLYAGQRGILTHPEAHLPLLRRATRWALPLRLIGSLLFTLISVSAPPVVALPAPAQTLLAAASVPGVLALSLAYVVGLTLLLQQPRWQARLAPLAAVGRMALTNYLLQSLVCTTLFYGYGLGWYSRVGPLAGIGLAALIFALQVPLSAWWLRRYRFGPAEWAWRSLTYGRPQPLRAPAPPTAAARAMGAAGRGKEAGMEGDY